MLLVLKFFYNFPYLKLDPSNMKEIVTFFVQFLKIPLFIKKKRFKIFFPEKKKEKELPPKFFSVS